MLSISTQLLRTMLSNSDCCCRQIFTQQEQNLIVINSTTQYLKEELLGSYNYYPKPLWSNVVFGISELWYRIVGFFHSLLKILYKRETFEGQNYCKLVKIKTFVERNFVDCLSLLRQDCHISKFCKENFRE